MDERTTMDPAVIDDDGEYEDRSGHDIDLMGDGSPVTAMLMPDRHSGIKDCPRKDDDGTCEVGCCECAAFLLTLENSARVGRLEES